MLLLKNDLIGIKEKLDHQLMPADGAMVELLRKNKAGDVFLKRLNIKR